MLLLYWHQPTSSETVNADWMLLISCVGVGICRLFLALLRHRFCTRAPTEHTPLCLCEAAVCHAYSFLEGVVYLHYPKLQKKKSEALFLKKENLEKHMNRCSLDLFFCFCFTGTYLYLQSFYFTFCLISVNPLDGDMLHLKPNPAKAFL